MASRRILHSGNLVRGIYAEEEIAWLEEHFIDFAREQYLVRYERDS